MAAGASLVDRLDAEFAAAEDHMVDDPIAHVRFPKYAAGATLDVNGKKVYFIDDATLREFQQSSRQRSDFVRVLKCGLARISAAA
jgi:hypothetical protein